MGTTDSATEKARVRDLIRDIRVTQLTTYDDDGDFYARPMFALPLSAQQSGFDGDIWFFTSIDSRKVDHISSNPKVLLCYADPADNAYVSVAGAAEIVRDRAKIESLWSEPLRAWFPDGPGDPAIALIKVHVTAAEYWDAPSSSMVVALDYLKARLRGHRPEIGDNKRVVF